MITENLSTLKIHKLTQAQYDRELAAGNIDKSALYLTPEASPDWNASEGEDGYILNKTHGLDSVDFEWSGIPSFSTSESLPAGVLYPYEIAITDKDFNYCTLSCGGTSWDIEVNSSKWSLSADSRVSFGPGAVYLARHNGALYMYATNTMMGHVGTYTINNCGNVKHLSSIYLSGDIARRGDLADIYTSISNINTLVGDTAVIDQIDAAITQSAPNWNSNAGEAGYIQNRTHYTINLDWSYNGTCTWTSISSNIDSRLVAVADLGEFIGPSPTHYSIVNLFGKTYSNLEFGKVFSTTTGPQLHLCLTAVAIGDNVYQLYLYSSNSGGLYGQTLVISDVKVVAQIDDAYISDTIARITDLKKINTVIANKSDIEHTHIIDDVVDLQSSLDEKAPIDSPEFTGSISLGRKPDTEIGTQSFAVGGYVEASGYDSHAEGSGTVASGHSSHAEGFETVALGYASHAEGRGTIAGSAHQHVQGKFNIEDATNTYVHIVGNGTSDSRSNAHTLDWAGNAWFAGSLSVGDAESTRANLGAAPAGYGYGETLKVIDHNSEASFEAFLNNELATMGDKQAKQIAFSCSDGLHGGTTYFGTLTRNISGYAVLYGCSADNAKVFKSVTNGVWSAFEWVNPPMLNGVEYRTTERWSGKAVYTKLIDCGKMPNNT